MDNYHCCEIVTFTWLRDINNILLLSGQKFAPRLLIMNAQLGCQMRDNQTCRGSTWG